MPPIVNDRVAWSVGLFVGLSPAEYLEAIEIQFAFRTRVGPAKHLLHKADRFKANTVLCLFNTIQPSSYYWFISDKRDW